MALVNVVNMVVLDNPTCFLNPFQFEITFECLQELEDDLEWKVLYVGSAHDTHLDQVLDEILVGPVPVGLNKFVLQADAPDPARLPPDELVGVTVVLVTCSYQEREFVRVGYYVNNEYTEPNYLAAVSAANAANAAAAAAAATYDPAGPIAEGEGGGEAENDNTSNNDNGEEGEQPQQKAVSVPAVPAYPHIEMQYVQRQILADKPRVTKFPIPWGKPEVLGQGQQAVGEQQQAGDAATAAAKGFAADDDNEMAGTPSTAATSSAAGSPMQMG